MSDAPTTLQDRLIQAITEHYNHHDGRGMTFDADELTNAFIAVLAFFIAMLPMMNQARARREYADDCAKKLKALIADANDDHSISGMAEAVTATPIDRSNPQ